MTSQDPIKASVLSAFLRCPFYHRRMSPTYTKSYPVQVAMGIGRLAR